MDLILGWLAGLATSVAVGPLLYPLELWRQERELNGTRDERYGWGGTAWTAPILPLSFRTKSGEGFSDCHVELLSRIDETYVDRDLSRWQGR
jgi:hypothetical protein